MKKHTDLQIALEQFNRDYPRPNIEPLELTPPLDIISAPKASWPSNEHPGVYLLMNAEMEILYVGKASCSSIIGAALQQHFNARWQPIDDKSRGCRYVTTIALPKDRHFEAPAIEEFMIKELDPPRNKQGK
jgi:excinuclease UvrABC nuclease subunit